MVSGGLGGRIAIPDARVIFPVSAMAQHHVSPRTPYKALRLTVSVSAHSYQYTFAPNKNWSGFYAPAGEICEYIKGVAEKYGATRFIHLKHKVTSAVWNDAAKKWSDATWGT